MNNESICLTCPGPCGWILEKEDDFFRCSNPNCIHHQQGEWFLKANRAPILISEINCDTVCSVSAIREDSKNPFVKRNLINNKFLKSFISFFKGDGADTRKKAENFISMMSASNFTKKRILVIGSGTKGLSTELLWDSQEVSITGIDIFETETVDFICDAHYLPFASDSFDGVWIQAVLEHVVDPVKVVSEIYRVLSSEGIVYAESPFMQQVHEGAYDFNRFTVLGHRYLFKSFDMIEMGGRESVGMPLAWSVRYLFWGIFRNQTIAKLLSAPFFLLLPKLEFLVTEKMLFDSSSVVYFLGKKSHDIISQKDLIDLYKGLQ